MARHADRRQRSRKQRRHQANVYVAFACVHQTRGRAQECTEEDACAHQPARIRPVNEVQHRDQRRSCADRSERHAQAHGKTRRKSQRPLVRLRKSHHAFGEGVPSGIGKKPRSHQREHGQQRYSNGPLQKGVLYLWGARAKASEQEKSQQQARRRARREPFQDREIYQPSPVEAGARYDFCRERKRQAGPNSFRRRKPARENEQRCQYGPAPDSCQAEQKSHAQPDSDDQKEAQWSFPVRSGAAVMRFACREDASKMLRPGMVAGRAIPNSARTVGAMSVKAGLSERTL